MVTTSEYRGHTLLVLKRNEEDPHPFQFGHGKAKLILEHIDAIRKFVDEEDLKKAV